MMMTILAGRALLATTVADLRPQEGDEPQLPDSHEEPVMMIMMMMMMMNMVMTMVTMMMTQAHS